MKEEEVLADDSSSHQSTSGAGSSGGTDSQFESTSETQNSSVQRDDDTHTIRNALAMQGTKEVFRLRVLVILLLVAAATSISVTVYYIIRLGEIDEFEQEFEALASKVLDAMQEVMIQMAAVSGLAVAATAETQKHYFFAEDGTIANVSTPPQQWPYVTISSFQERAGNAQTLAGAIYVSICPIVTLDQLSEWERYVHSDANYWIQEGLTFQDKQGLNDFVDPEEARKNWLTTGAVDPLHTFDATGMAVLSGLNGPFLPRWQTSPVLQTSMVNENVFENPQVSSTARDSIASKAAVLGGFRFAPPGSTSHPDPTTSFYATLLSMAQQEQTEYLGDPISNLFIPIFDRLDGGENREVVAVLKSTIHWASYLRNILPSTNKGVMVVVENACDGNYTYFLDGTEAYVVGSGDQHENEFSMYQVSGQFTTDVLDDGTIEGIELNQEGCPYTFHVYPTEKDYNSHATNSPVIISISVAAVFLFTIIMFFAYDHLVERRQKLVLAKATQSTAIVSSLFPKQVRDRLLAMENDKRKGNALMAPTHRLKSYLSGAAVGAEDQSAQPIADFFPNCTVFFADISGFTAWSSSREPAQVFFLLQTIYSEFDIIAKRRGVFKVETIGDSYVAVTGLPEPQSRHATIMARFAWDCLIRIGEITKELEVSLGPDTGELSMRFGLHSGSVTAGVLKGDRARFQLFGDTVNTAARMESTGAKGRIQVSESTAKILIESGKESWLIPRDDKVSAKGKGVLSTYWLTLKTGVRTSTSRGSSGIGDSRHFSSGDFETSNRLDMKESRLIDWMCDILLDHCKKIIIVRERCTPGAVAQEDLSFQRAEGRTCLDEVQDVMRMPEFSAKVMDAALDSNEVKVPFAILEDLREYVTVIARTYRNNPFHNFEHACHVTMSVSKLLSRVVTPDLKAQDVKSLRKGRNELAAGIHNFTHGIASDPMTSFAIVFSALIHDVDHRGVSNVQLMKEEPEMGDRYHGKSVAEQNSLDIAWDMLMHDRFEKLRKFIFATKSAMMRFRQLIVNVVLATDIFDKELGDLRKDRWNRAFHGDGSLNLTLKNDLRATIVIEHIIQASDVSHTMQHWHVYQKWNRKLFEEMYQAWKNGRMGADPRTFWYKGELGFFDNYVIPLAKKLKECNVFGVSSDEYLGYAERNRAEWAEKGEDILKKLIEELDSEKPEKALTPVSSSHTLLVDNDKPDEPVAPLSKCPKNSLDDTSSTNSDSTKGLICSA